MGKNEDCAELLKTIYGTKQAARQYYMKFMKVMKDKGFTSTTAESCLLKRIDKNGTVIICVYVDDCFITGVRKAIDAAMNDINSVFETRRIGRMSEYIGCTLVDLGEDGSKKLMQPDMIKKLEQEFGPDVADLREALTPMGPGNTVERPSEDDPQLSTEEQKRYRSGVGMLLYLVKL